MPEPTPRIGDDVRGSLRRVGGLTSLRKVLVVLCNNSVCGCSFGETRSLIHVMYSVAVRNTKISTEFGSSASTDKGTKLKKESPVEALVSGLSGDDRKG